MITSGEAQIKESNTIEQEYKSFEAEELGVETEVASKLRVLSKERKSTIFEQSDAQIQLSMKPKNVQKKLGSNLSQSPLSTLHAVEILHKQMSQSRISKNGYGKFIQTTTNINDKLITSGTGLPPTKPSSAHPSRRQGGTRMMPNNR